MRCLWNLLDVLILRLLLISTLGFWENQHWFYSNLPTTFDKILQQWMWIEKQIKIKWSWWRKWAKLFGLTFALMSFVRIGINLILHLIDAINLSRKIYHFPYLICWDASDNWQILINICSALILYGAFLQYALHF